MDATPARWAQKLMDSYRDQGGVNTSEEPGAGIPLARAVAGNLRARGTRHDLNAIRVAFHMVKGAGQRDHRASNAAIAHQQI